MSELLFLESKMHEKIWGGQRLQSVFGYDIPSQKTGEYWAISAHPNGPSVIKNGKYKGQGLDKLYQDVPELFGFPTSPVFPLLTKILDADDWLSVQVHPDNHYALANEGELGKTECWYILEADLDAEIIYGHTAQSKSELSKLISEGNWDKLLTRVPVKAGDFFFVPSGTMHAIGKGVMILETQQSSDTTYRVYDFDRKNENGLERELHIEKSIDVLTLGQPQNTFPDLVRLENIDITTFASTPFFTVYKWEIHGKCQMLKSSNYTLVSVIQGHGEIIVDGDSYPIAKGDHFIIPSTIDCWKIEGNNLAMIASHPNEIR